MKPKNTRHKLIIIALIILTTISCSKRPNVKMQDYQRAEKFLPENIEKLAYKMQVSPNWIDSTSMFWYVNKTRSGKEFIFVNPSKKTKVPAFDQEKLANALSRAMNKSYTKDSLPFNNFTYKNELKEIEFSTGDTTWECSLQDYSCKVINSTSAIKNDRYVQKSPDGKWIAFTKNYNLYIRSTETGKEIQLTKDGTEDLAYATPLPSSKEMAEQGTTKIKSWTDVEWSPDSKKLVTYQMDQRNAGKLYLVQSCPPDMGRPKSFSYTYPLPTDSILPKAHLVLFNIEKVQQIKLNAEISLQYVGGPFLHTWFDKGNYFYYLQFQRGYRKAYINEVNLNSGKERVAMEEQSDTYVDPNRVASSLLKNGEEFIWASEQDGWNHLYLYDIKKSQMVNQITKGNFFVRDIAYVDEDARVVYFIGAGVEDGKNPYFRFLYKVNFDGSGITLLTPENTDHGVTFSPDGTYFIDNYSTVDTPPVILLKKSFDGKTILSLEEADVTDLIATGWTKPEEFKVKAGDGKTDIYGVIYKPANFDSSKKYPVLDKIYTGPHNFFAAKNFRAFASEANSFAQLGFIVIEIDGRGTGKRSKEFHNYSYKNLGGGSDDHIVGIKELAEKHRYLDIDKVGIFGFSAGGYDAFHAMCKYPDFYKVGISASGNHDHRVDKTWWNELWMGYPLGKNYDEQSNYNPELIKNFKGKILISHGELDNNVNPYATMRLIDALIKQNKDFEMMIVPSQYHFLDQSPYYVRRRWDFFVENLMGATHPKEYKIGDLKEE